MRVYSADGKLIGEFGEMRRTPLPIENAPHLMVLAIVAAEDNRFFEHHGVDTKGLMRAAGELLTTAHIRTGGSTITMQVAKNYFLSPERTFSRKFSEILLALNIERHLSKPEILNLYINKIYLGNRAYGVQAAAQVYYGRDIHDLTLAELAMLAGLPKAPSAFNPLSNPDRAMLRRNWILARMLDLGFIDKDAYETARQSPNTASLHGANIEVDAPHVAEMARMEAVARVGADEAYTTGLVVHTTLDSHLQETAQQALRKGLLEYDWRHGYRRTDPLYKGAGTPAQTRAGWLAALRKYRVIGGLVPAIVSEVADRQVTCLLRDGSTVTIGWEQGLSSARLFRSPSSRGPAPAKAADVLAAGQLVRLLPAGDGSWKLRQIPQAQSALVSLNPGDGAILALVGGFDFQQSKFNRAAQAMRQLGSNFKPFLYSAALENGFTAASIINDAPLVFEDPQMENVWRPENSTGKFKGPTTLREALTNSRNLVSIRILKELGVAKAIDYAARFGFDRRTLPPDLSMALGTHSTTPLNVVSAYAALANGGYRVFPYLVTRIEDMNGSVRYAATPTVACEACLPPAPLPAADGTPPAPPIAPATPVTTPEGLPVAQRIMDPRVNYIMYTILQDVIRKGTAKQALALGRNDIAGKTGTTNGPTDAWFSGFNRDVVTTVWLGFDQNQYLGQNEYGGTTALPIWMDFMKVALKDKPDLPRAQPEGLVMVRINADTGLRAGANDPNAVMEYFTRETAPAESAGPGPGAAEGRNAVPWDLF